MTQEQKDILSWYNRTYGTSIDVGDWADRVDWWRISQSQSLSEGFIREFSDRVKWEWISRRQSLSEGFIREFSGCVNWANISRFQFLSEEFIREFQDRVDWRGISAHQSLSEGFIREFSDRVHWGCISANQSLSEGFIREFSGRVDWSYISVHQSLSEEFIREFQDRVNWWCISIYQSLSEGFIREFADLVKWGCISRSQLLSEEFLKEFSDRIQPDHRQDNWLYADRATKLRHIREKAPEFETQEDENGPFIVAYKATQKGGRSDYRPSIRYEVGGIYESRCHHDMREENSFGLSAWTREGAQSHVPGGELYRVKIYVDDIGAMVHDGKKIRCKRQEFIERIK